MLKCILTAQARTKCVSAFWAQSGPWHFFCLHSYALTCKSLYMLHIEFYNVVQVYSILIKLINGGNLYKSC